MRVDSRAWYGWLASAEAYGAANCRDQALCSAPAPHRMLSTVSVRHASGRILLIQSSPIWVFWGELIGFLTPRMNLQCSVVDKTAPSCKRVPCETCMGGRKPASRGAYLGVDCGLRCRLVYCSAENPKIRLLH